MIDIVIVNWNSDEYLKVCVASIFVQKNEAIVNKVIIVDNNSSDESLHKISQHNKIVLIKNADNNGFAKACNQGYAVSTATYVLFLNPDTQLYENTLSDCLNFMEQHAEIDVVGCQLLDDNGTITHSCARFPTPFTMFNDASGLSKIAPKIFKPATLMNDWDHKESRFVDQLTGAFMFMRSESFKRIGYFDERFFVYFEELDFSLRLAKTGGKSYFNATIKALHSGEGTTNKVKAFRLFLSLRSRLLYAKKHFSPIGYSFVYFSTFFIEPLSRGFFLLISGRLNEMKDLFKGYKLLIKD